MKRDCNGTPNTVSTPTSRQMNSQTRQWSTQIGRKSDITRKKSLTQLWWGSSRTLSRTASLTPSLSWSTLGQTRTTCSMMQTRLGRNLRHKWNKSFILNVQANHACSCHQIWDPFSKMCHDIFCSTDQVHMSHNIPGSIQENWTWNALESFDHRYAVKSFLSKATNSQVLEQFVCKGNHRNTTKEGSWLDMTWKKNMFWIKVFQNTE